ncbi:MAG: hypothetical protein KDA42_08375 [Planctomycetales bacterium]|nr:hypothetical protein [Planctomycetales bacterium]
MSDDDVRQDRDKRNIRKPDAIAQRLGKIHVQAQRDVAAGPFREGLPADHRVSVAAFDNPRIAARFQNVLLKEGISSHLESSGGEHTVFVDAGDCSAAAELLKQRARQYPTRSLTPQPRGSNGLRAGTLFGVCVGVGCALAVRLLLLADVEDVVQLGLVIWGLCAAVGAWLDRRPRDPVAGRTLGLLDLLLGLATFILGLGLLASLFGLAWRY